MNRNLAAANVLLDAVSAFDREQGVTPQNEAAMRLAFQRFLEIDAVRVIDEDDGSTRVDISPILHGAVATLAALVFQIADEREAEPEAVIAVIREHLEEHILNE